MKSAVKTKARKTNNQASVVRFLPGAARADSDRPGLSTLGLEFSLRLSGDNKCCTRQSGDNAQPQAEWG